MDSWKKKQSRRWRQIEEKQYDADCVQKAITHL